MYVWMSHGSGHTMCDVRVNKSWVMSHTYECATHIRCDVCVSESWVMPHIEMRYAAYVWFISLYGAMIDVKFGGDVCVWMSHGSCLTYEWVMPRVNETCHCVARRWMWRMDFRCDVCMHESWVMSHTNESRHIPMSHVAYGCWVCVARWWMRRIDIRCDVCVYSWVKSHVTYEWAMSRVTYEWAMSHVSHMNESCHIRLLGVCGATMLRMTDTGWQSLIRSLIFIGHFLQKWPIFSGSFVEKDLQLKGSYEYQGSCVYEKAISHATYERVRSYTNNLSHLNESCRTWLLGVCGAMIDVKNRYQVVWCVYAWSHESCHIWMRYQIWCVYTWVMSHDTQARAMSHIAVGCACPRLLVKILKCQRATTCIVQNDSSTDFWEILKRPLASTCAVENDFSADFWKNWAQWRHIRLLTHENSQNLVLCGILYRQLGSKLTFEKFTRGCSTGFGLGIA